MVDLISRSIGAIQFKLYHPKIQETIKYGLFETAITCTRCISHTGNVAHMRTARMKEEEEEEEDIRIIAEE